MNDFDYLKETDVYLDAACQSLRPRPVINALNEYYEKHNSCGERVKYKWGEETDKKVEETREKVLKFLKLKSRDYFVSFTLNTTYGLNLVLEQLNVEKLGLKKVITSDIEHNSPFLSTITFAKKNKLPREIVERADNGEMPLDYDYEDSVVVVNNVCNFDGRRLENIKELTKKVHKSGGIIIIDAAQGIAHDHDLLEKTDADVICFSAHKMYSASLGGIIMKRSLIPAIDTAFVGGGMVDDVDKESFVLSATNPDHAHTLFEPGLQAWGEIIALGAALDWLSNLKKSEKTKLETNATELFDILNSHDKIHLLNSEPRPTMSFYVDRKELGYDSHLLGSALADQGIMARTGYFCAHYFLDHKKHYPPLVRFSLGYHIRESDIEKVRVALAKI